MSADESPNTRESFDAESPETAKLTARIAGAFERMPVPPGPLRRDSLALLADSSDHRRRPGLSRRQRLALGGLGLSTAAALALLLFALNSGQQLSAMERMVQKLQDVKSYSYKIESENTFYDDGQREPTIVSEQGVSFWQAPDAFDNETKIVRSQAGADGIRTEQVVEDFAEVFPAGRPGMYIDHKYKVYRRLPNEPDGSPMYPWDMLRLIRENSGEILRELGTKELHGRQARGYVIVLKGLRGPREDDQVHDPVEVWVDPATDLPVEFDYRGKHDEPDQHGAGYWLRATDFHWNVDVDPGQFEPRPPAGYTDIAPPDAKRTCGKSSTPWRSLPS